MSSLLNLLSEINLLHVFRKTGATLPPFTSQQKIIHSKHIVDLCCVIIVPASSVPSPIVFSSISPCEILHGGKHRNYHTALNTFNAHSCVLACRLANMK